MAVFQYEVPKTASHYEINTPVEQIEPNTASSRWASDGGMSARLSTAIVHNKPGYKGSLWIDPASGTILRVTLVADLKGDSAISTHCDSRGLRPGSHCKQNGDMPGAESWRSRLRRPPSMQVLKALRPSGSMRTFSPTTTCSLLRRAFSPSSLRHQSCRRHRIRKAHLKSRLYLPPARSRLSEPRQPNLCRSRRQPHPSMCPQASSRLFRLRRQRPRNKTRQITKPAHVRTAQAATPPPAASVPAT